MNLSFALLGLLQEETTSTGSWTLADTQSLTDIISKTITAFAVVIGGVWAYFRFRKERTHESNLELTVSGEAVRKDGVIHLRVTVNAKNIGSSKIEIFHPFSAFRVLGCKVDADTEGANIAEWVDFDKWPLLADQEHLEPAEPIVDTHLILVYGGDEWAALKLEVYVCASNDEANKLIEKLEEKGLEGLEEAEVETLEKLDSWVTTSIANLASEGDNISADGRKGERDGYF